MHPILFLSSGSYHAQERLDQIRKDIQSGHAKNLWQNIKAQADDELDSDLITTATALPHRGADQIEMRNIDAILTKALEKRIMRHALVFHLTHDERYRDNALAQLKLMFDKEIFPAWCDLAAYRNGKKEVHLRTGAMAKTAGIAYDWLKDSLSPNEKQEIIEGLDRLAIQPYLAELKEIDPWWQRPITIGVPASLEDSLSPGWRSKKIILNRKSLSTSPFPASNITLILSAPKVNLTKPLAMPKPWF